jgi:hypothetical protein
MNRETIIQMAREAGLAEVTDTAESLPADYVEALAKLCALAVAKEREECAKVCESFRDVREEARAALRVADALKSRWLFSTCSAHAVALPFRSSCDML